MLPEMVRWQNSYSKISTKISTTGLDKMDVQTDELLTRKLELMLEMNAKRLIAEMQGMKEQLSSLQKEITLLRKQVNRPVAAQQVQQPASQQPALNMQPSAPTQPKAENKNNLPSELSIESVFYCGKK